MVHIVLLLHLDWRFASQYAWLNRFLVLNKSSKEEEQNYIGVTCSSKNENKDAKNRFTHFCFDSILLFTLNR